MSFIEGSNRGGSAHWDGSARLRTIPTRYSAVDELAKSETINEFTKHGN